MSASLLASLRWSRTSPSVAPAGCASLHHRAIITVAPLFTCHRGHAPPGPHHPAPTAHSRWLLELLAACSRARCLAVGASNLGHVILYSLLNQQQGLLCDRAYYPGEDLQVCKSSSDCLVGGLAFQIDWTLDRMRLGCFVRLCQLSRGRTCR